MCPSLISRIFFFTLVTQQINTLLFNDPKHVICTTVNVIKY